MTEGWYGEGGGSGVQDGEHVYTLGLVAQNDETIGLLGDVRLGEMIQVCQRQTRQGFIDCFLLISPSDCFH